MFGEAVVIVLVLLVVWQVARTSRWPKKGCKRCNGSGGFTATTWLTGQAIRRPCSRCGGNGWGGRVGGPSE